MKSNFPHIRIHHWSHPEPLSFSNATYALTPNFMLSSHIHQNIWISVKHLYNSEGFIKASQLRASFCCNEQFLPLTTTYSTEDHNLQVCAHTLHIHTVYVTHTFAMSFFCNYQQSNKTTQNVSALLLPTNMPLDNAHPLTSPKPSRKILLLYHIEWCQVVT